MQAITVLRSMGVRVPQKRKAGKIKTEKARKALQLRDLQQRRNITLNYRTIVFYIIADSFSAMWWAEQVRLTASYEKQKYSDLGCSRIRSHRAGLGCIRIWLWKP